MPRYNVNHNGKWATFSTIVDGFISPFVSKEEHEEWRKKEYGLANFEPVELCNIMSIEEAISHIKSNRTFGDSVKIICNSGISKDEAKELLYNYKTKNIGFEKVCISRNLGININYFNANPVTQEESGDCAIRSLSKLYDINWVDMHRNLCAISQELGSMPDNMKVICEYLQRNKAIMLYSWVQQIEDEEEPIRVVDVVCDRDGRFKKGKYFISITCPDHCFVFIDDIVYDTVNINDFDSFLVCIVDYIYEIL